jgi:hypothetical protein
MPMTQEAKTSLPPETNQPQALESTPHPWPSTLGAADLGVRSDEVEEWLEANWYPE